MAGKSASKNGSLVMCPCGTRVRALPKGTRTREVCASCGLSLRVEWGTDGRGRPSPLVVYASREGGTVRSARPSTPPPRPPTPSPRPPTPSPRPPTSSPRPPTPPPQPAPADFRCDCGTILQVGPEHVGLGIACPDCGAESAIQRVRDPQTFATVLKKVTTKPGTARRRKGDADSRLKETPSTDSLWCVCGRQLQVRHDDVGKQAECHACGRLMKLETVKDPQTLRLTIRAVNLEGDSAQELICSCGAEMMVYPQDLGKQLQCARCGTQMKVKKVRDAETQTTALQVKVVGEDETLKTLHDEEWSLDDFK